LGQTIDKLASRQISGNPIFSNRFVVEICEKVHVHYRNLRILMSKSDFVEMALGMRDALSRWEKQGRPEPKEGVHIELCRKDVASDPQGNDSIDINHNKNLYVVNDGKIFAEGAEFCDQTYIHLKIRDLRIELSLGEFNELAEAIALAKDGLNERV